MNFPRVCLCCGRWFTPRPFRPIHVCDPCSALPPVNPSESEERIAGAPKEFLTVADMLREEAA
jgi:hypothetical protein